MTVSNQWQFQEAKARLSEVLDKAKRQGPQLITRHGHDEGYLVSARDFVRMESRQMKLSEFFRNSPLAGLNLQIDRDQDMGRETPDLK